jgi:hypothetical protein
MVSDGFLTSPKDDGLLARLTFYINEKSLGVIFVNRYDGSNKFNVHLDDPLFARGWAMQELLLSPRTLIFDAYQITLNCRADQFKSIIPAHINFHPLCASLPLPILESRHSDESTWNKEEQSKVWKELVEEYTGRDLTLFEDRLPALSGIASELSTHLGRPVVSFTLRKYS